MHRVCSQELEITSKDVVGIRCVFSRRSTLVEIHLLVQGSYCLLGKVANTGLKKLLPGGIAD